MTTGTMTRIYRAPEVCRRAGITYRQLDYWIRTGVIEIDDPYPGSGDQRLYTAEHLTELTLIRKLLDVGFKLSAIRREGPRELQAKARRALK